MQHRTPFPSFIHIFLVATAAGPTTWAADEEGAWISLASMSIPRQECGAARIGDQVYVVGGLLAGVPLSATNTVEVYDINQDTWSFVSPMPIGLDHMAVAAVNGLLYVVGGYSADFRARSEVWIYNPESETWSGGSLLPSARGACWAVTFEGKVYLFGGVDSTGATRRTTFIFDPSMDSWTMGEDMPTAREHLTAVVEGDHIYVIGGRNGGSTPANERYHPASDEWTVMTPMPTARSATATAAFAGKIYVAGGEVPELFAVNEVYDVQTDSWSSAIPMAIPRHGLAAVTLDDRIFTPAGGTVQGLSPTNAVDSFVPACDAVECCGCVLDLAAGFTDGILTLDLLVGTEVPAIFSWYLWIPALGPLIPLGTGPVPAVCPPQAFHHESPLPCLGTISLIALLTDGQQQVLCWDWTGFIDTCPVSFTGQPRRE